MPPPRMFCGSRSQCQSGISAICSLIFRRGMIDVDFVHYTQRSTGTMAVPYSDTEGQGEEAIRKALSELLIAPCSICRMFQGGRCPAYFYMRRPTWNEFLQHASLEIREQFKAGEHVVFGAHVDENMGDHVQIIVLGATDLEAGLQADVAPLRSRSCIPQGKKATSRNSPPDEKHGQRPKRKATIHPAGANKERRSRIRTCSILWKRQPAWNF